MKKHNKRLVSLLLVCAFMISLVPSTTIASIAQVAGEIPTMLQSLGSNGPQAMQLGEEYTVIPETNEETYNFTFTPSEPGQYALIENCDNFADYGGACYENHIETQSGQYVASFCGGMFYHCKTVFNAPESLETLNISVSLLMSRSLECSFKVVKLVAPTELEFKSISNMVVGERGSFTVGYPQDEAGMFDCTFTSSDSDVAEIICSNYSLGYSIEVDVTLVAKKAGSTVITATAPDGVTSISKEITVVDSNVADLGTTYTGSDVSGFQFTPSESGYYGITLSNISTDSTNYRFEISASCYDEYGTPWNCHMLNENDWSGTYHEGFLEADKTYTFTFHLKNGDNTREFIEGSYEYVVEKLSLPTDFELLPEIGYDINVVDDVFETNRSYIQLQMNYIGEPGEKVVKLLNSFNYSLSDDSVANIDCTNIDGSPYISLLSPGTCEITVTVNDILTKTYKINVLDKPSLKLDEVISVDGDGQWRYMNFTPDEDGYYRLSTVNMPQYSMYWVGLEFNTANYASGQDGLNYYCDAYLVGGQTYVVGYYCEGNFEFLCKKVDEPTSIKFADFEKEVKYVGVSEPLSVEMVGDNSTKCVTNVEFSSSNTTIAAVNAWGEVTYKRPGKVTITATLDTANGILKDTIDLEVISTPQIGLNQTKTMNNGASIAFVPSVSGIYSFTYSNINGHNNYNYHYDFNIVKSGSHEWVECCFSENYSEARLNAGTEYIITAGYNTYEGQSEANCSFDLTVRKPSNPTSGEIVEEEYSANSPRINGFQANYVLNFEGDNVVRYLNSVTWEASDSSILDMDGQGADSIFVRCKNPGTTKLTATVNGKFTLEKEVTVLEPNVNHLTDNQSRTFKFVDAQDIKVLAFEPTQSGAYNLVLDYNSLETGTSYDYDWEARTLTLYDANGSQVCMTTGSMTKNQLVCRFKDLQAGQTYYISVSSKVENDEVTVSAFPKKSVTKIEINPNSTMKTEYVENVLAMSSYGNVIDLTGLKLDITWSDGSVTTRRSAKHGFSAEDMYLSANYAQHNGKDCIEVWLDGCMAYYEVTSVESPVKSIKVLDQKPIVEGVDGYMGWDINGKEIWKYNVYADKLNVQIEFKDGTVINSEYNINVLPDGTVSPSMNGDEYDIEIGYYVDDNTVRLEDAQWANGEWSVDGENLIAVTYMGVSTPYNVVISENNVAKLEVIKGPDNMRIVSDNDLFSGRGDGPVGIWNYDLKGMVFRIHYNDGSYVDCTAEEHGEYALVFDRYMYGIVDWEKWIDISDKGNIYSDVTFNYCNAECTYTIPYVVNPVKEINILTPPHNTTIYADDNNLFENYAYEDPKTGELIESRYIGYEQWYSWEHIEGLSFEVIYNDGTTRIYTSDEFEYDENYGTFMVDNYQILMDPPEINFENLVGSYEISIVYKNVRSDTFDVSIEESMPIEGVSLESSENVTASVSGDSKATSIDMAKEQLDETQRLAVENGESTLETKISVKEATSQSDTIFTIAAEDAQEIGLSLDIDITYELDGQEIGKVSDTGDRMIAITIELPKELQGKDKYTVYRDHNGEVEMLDNPKVSLDGTKLTFYSSLFSSYGIAYDESELGATVFGQVETYNTNHETTIELKQDGVTKYITTIAETPGTGKEIQQFAIANVVPGTYDLVVTKNSHLAYTVKGIAVGKDDVDLRTNANENISMMKLLCGDFDASGTINADDLAILWSDSNYLRTLEEGVDNVFTDLDGSGAVNGVDLAILWNDNNYHKNTFHCTFDYVA